MTEICERLGVQLGALYSCSQQERYVRLRTPFLYPDGDVIDVYYVDQQGAATLTDLGETVRWLRMQSVSVRRSPKQQQLIQDICLNHGVEFFKGMISLRVPSIELLAESVTRISQACIRVADLWFTMRTRAVQSVTDEVEDYLREREIQFEREKKLIGRSGRGWTIDFHTRTPRRSALVLVLASGSRASANGVVKHVVTVWHDLRDLVAGVEPVRAISLFDDTLDVWNEEDFKLVEGLSDVARWSRPDEFESALRSA
jgi:hypothetical protein